jgi:uncharacterized membrane protein
MQIKQILKENAIPFVTFVILSTLVFHIVKYLHEKYVNNKNDPTYSFQRYMKDDIKSYIPPSSIFISLIYVIFIRSCFKHSALKTGLYTFILTYFTFFVIIGMDENYSILISKELQLGAVIISFIISVIAMITNRIAK